MYWRFITLTFFEADMMFNSFSYNRILLTNSLLSLKEFNHIFVAHSKFSK